ncbi:hypothetical protein [Nitrosopumilus sp.]|uniref:hypothetical protein n=1 Tax=Nitrosopumilus sp. TaxID=2024843 RepID=UPI003B5A9754
MNTRLLITIGIIAAIITAATVIGIFLILMPQEYDLPENDRLCSTHVLVQTTHKVDRKVFSETVLREIGLLDYRFDYDGRGILVTNMGDNKLRITIDGLWSIENAGSSLLESLENLEYVESVLKQGDILLAIECQ